ncbi:MAG: ABC transporter permease [Deltaproteobacteria bacterium CG23_combo_of_CG06-09_8_20_14_all_60_8]|nr:MAG: hypothetical protein AUK28_01440 [Desulfobacterales bacterium CG2_30_60_27]PIP43893.1 MAG: ABC transporter permease [Deltaproteobacteria bacterium CG23_combo_of_CG06-09_8_20_14_all_60_8]
MANPLLERQINFLDYTLSSLWRKRYKNLAVVVVFAVVIFLLASFQLVSNGLLERAQTALVMAPEILIQKMTAGRQESIPIAYAERLHDIFGIRQVVPRVWGYYFDEVTLANYTVIGRDQVGGGTDDQLAQVLSEGRLPTAANETVLGQAVFRTKGLQEQRIFSLFRPDLSLKTLTVTGLFKKESNLLTDDLIVLSLADARDLFGLPDGLASDLMVTVANPREISTVAKKISEALPGTRVLTRPQIEKTYHMIFGWRSGFASVCLLAALAAFFIFAWDKASGLAPDEKREIAILKILGWQTADVLVVRFWEGAVISLAAYLLGCTAAYIHVVFFGSTLFLPVLAGWSVIRPDLHLLPAIHLADLLLLFCLTVMPYLTATVVPAWRCASLPSDTALQGG